jgi:hypothetical protein
MVQIEDYERKGLFHETQILNAMLSLWSPFIRLESIGYSGDSGRNPSHPVEIKYDFEPLAKDYHKYRKTGYSDSVQTFRELARYYPIVKNLNVDASKARTVYAPNGLKGSPAVYEVGRYYMGQRGLVIYLEERIEDNFVVYVLNLWSDYLNELMLQGKGINPYYGLSPEDFQIKGEFKPWFNIYVAPLWKLQNEYKLDVTEWINPIKEISFMNWKENPLEVK